MQRASGPEIVMKAFISRHNAPAVTTASPYLKGGTRSGHYQFQPIVRVDQAFPLDKRQNATPMHCRLDEPTGKFRMTKFLCNDLAGVFARHVFFGDEQGRAGRKQNSGRRRKRTEVGNIFRREIGAEP